MSHKPIALKNVGLMVGGKHCFEHFTKEIHWGKHIAIMGINGAGKSTLLKIIQGIIESTTGEVVISPDITFGYVAQTISDYPELSGGQRFNKMLSSALSLQPDVLCLDEPTNHLDLNNKRSLVRMLSRYEGTLIVVSHDPELLKLDFDEIWHIEHGSIVVFAGTYTEYLKEHELTLQNVERQHEYAQKEKRQLRTLSEKENQRAASSKTAHKNENDRVRLGAMKERGGQTSGKKQKLLSQAYEGVEQKLATVFVHKKIEPKFNFNARSLSLNKTIVSISNGSCGYQNPVLHDINFQLQGAEKIALVGDNGTGKTTFLKALLNDPQIVMTGQWLVPSKNHIGYLDQHYSTLSPDLTVVEVMQEAVPAWTTIELRKHLNDFLFRTQTEVGTKVMHLSGGEKVRLCLAFIAATTPTLLILDEVTNNIDLDTRAHLIEVLKVYPGAMIVITHDMEFVEQLGISTLYETKNGQFFLKELLV